MQDDELWAIEQRLWRDGPAAYEEVLDPACIMAFPQMGLLRARQVIETLEKAPRWEDVTMRDRAIGRAGDAAAVLAYSAEAHREGADPYRCLCTSTYRRDADAWRLIQHQQSPAD